MGAEVTGVCSTDEAGLRRVARRRPRDRLHEPSTTRGPASGTTGSSTPDSHHSHPRRPAGAPTRTASTSPSAGPRWPIFAALLVGPLISPAQRQMDGPAALVEAVRPGRRRDPQAADRRGQGQAGHRPALSARARSSKRCATSTTATPGARSSSRWRHPRLIARASPAAAGWYPAAGALASGPDHRNHRAGAAGPELPLAPAVDRHQQRRRRRRARRRSAARGVADAGPVPRLDGPAERVPAGAAVRRARRRGRRPVRSTPHGRRWSTSVARSSSSASSPRSSPGRSTSRVVLVVLFVLGTAETFADAASSTLLPGPRAREDLGIANARMQGAFLLTNQLLTPPIGAFLFAVGMALPFATNAACFALGAVLVSRVVTSTTHRGRGAAPACAPRWPRASAGSRPIRRCGRWRSRSSPSTSRTGRRGPCSSCTPASGWAWTRSGSAC